MVESGCGQIFLHFEIYVLPLRRYLGASQFFLLDFKDQHLLVRSAPMEPIPIETTDAILYLARLRRGHLALIMVDAARLWTHPPAQDGIYTERDAECFALHNP